MFFIMCGLPGSGKSYFINNVKGQTDIVISRDEIRFSLIKDNEDYFKYEKEVLTTFFSRIEEADKATDKNVWIDATHLTTKARKKVLSRIKHNKVSCVYFEPNLVKCLERNEQRTSRAFVPENVIFQMLECFEAPRKEEGFEWVINIQN